MPLSPSSSNSNVMAPSTAPWVSDVQALVRRHKYDFNAAAAEVGATPKELRMELAASKQHKQQHVRHRHPHLGSD